MPIPESILGRWSHHHPGIASKQAHVSIRNALASYKGWTKETKYNIFLQGSYKNDTNLRRDSDVDVVVQLTDELPHQVAKLSGSQLEHDQDHRTCIWEMEVVSQTGAESGCIDTWREVDG